MIAGNFSIDIDVADDVNLGDFPGSDRWGDLFINLADIMSSRFESNEDKDCTIRFVSEYESRHLNKTYRDKDKSTNVLSFPADLPDFVKSNFIGDIAICLAVLKSESQLQNKLFEHHLLHIICHGILHLIGFDHITDKEAEIMETHEKSILAELGIDDPYQVQ